MYGPLSSARGAIARRILQCRHRRAGGGASHLDALRFRLMYGDIGDIEWSTLAAYVLYR